MFDPRNLTFAGRYLTLTGLAPAVFGIAMGALSGWVLWPLTVGGLCFSLVFQVLATLVESYESACRESESVVSLLGRGAGRSR